MQLIAGRYEPLEVIASGGMATVWRARDHRLDRLVALKRPHPNVAQEAAGVRMDREARAAAALSHPNLVTVYDYGTDDEGPYLVMELLTGPTLADMLGEVDVASAIDIAAQLADGLAFIHAAGIVHRDVKPANVVMSAHGPQLTDFGIAVDPAVAGDITDPGHVVATPMFAAPEVLSGGEPTPGSDVYSLARVIEELSKASGIPIDADFEAILADAKAPTPGERPSAASLARRLRDLTPTVARPVTPAGSTLVMPTTAGPVATDETEGTRRRISAWAIAPLAALLVVGGLVALGLTLSSDDTSANASGPLASDDTTTTILATTSTDGATTIATLESDLQAARQELETVLLEPPRSDLKASEVDDLMDKIDEAYALVEEEKDKEASKKISDVAKTIDDKLEDDSRDRAMELIEEISRLLGVEFERPG